MHSAVRMRSMPKEVSQKIDNGLPADLPKSDLSVKEVEEKYFNGNQSTCLNVPHLKLSNPTKVTKDKD